MPQEGAPRFPRYVAGTPEELDAVAAAPENHEVLFENDMVRVLRVVIRPGEVENKHTHKWPSVFTIYKLPKIKYFNDEGRLVPLPGNRSGVEGHPFWMEAEGVHWVENHDTFSLDAIRVELKN